IRLRIGLIAGVEPAAQRQHRACKHPLRAHALLLGSPRARPEFLGAGFCASVALKVVDTAISA
ncbi:MAG: hypothetical protein WBW74_10875, partial [Xanthobacteraceae bacterium]